MLVSYGVLDSSNNGSAKLLTDCFVTPEEACREWIFGRDVDWLVLDREDVARAVVDDFIDDNRLNTCLGPQAKCSDLGLNELTDIRIVSLLLVGPAVIGSGWSSECVAAFSSAIFSSNSIYHVICWGFVAGPG